MKVFYHKMGGGLIRKIFKTNEKATHFNNYPDNLCQIIAVVIKPDIFDIINRKL